MVKRLLNILCLTLIFGTLSCAQLAHQSMPEEGTADLEILKQKCTACHGLPHPKRHTANEWDHLLVLMMERMKERRISYTSQEMQQIKSYLRRNAR